MLLENMSRGSRMKGKHKVVVKNNKLHYEFEIKRNITIIKGDSATGKTTLINMIRQYANLGVSSGVDVVCDVPCRILEGADWQLVLQNISGIFCLQMKKMLLFVRSSLL